MAYSDQDRGPVVHGFVVKCVTAACNNCTESEEADMAAGAAETKVWLFRIPAFDADEGPMRRQIEK